MAKWKYNNTLREITEINDNNEEVGTVFMTEDMNPDAMESLVQQYNDDYSLTRIKSNLEADERLTEDEVNYIMEEIELYEEKRENAVALEPVTVEPAQEEPVSAPVQTEKPKRTKQPRTTTVSRKQSPEEYIKALEEKIELTRFVNDICTVGDIPENLSKKGRDLLLELSKKMNGLIEQTLEDIQTL